MSTSTTSDQQVGSARWRSQRWLVDDTVRASGIEFDQNRLQYSLGPARDETSGADIAILRLSIKKLADLTELAAFHAERHERLAQRLHDSGHAITAGVHWFIAAQLWLMGAWPMWETTDELVEFHRRKVNAFDRWIAVADHRVERVNIPFADSALPGYLHLPPGFSGGALPTVVATDGMDGGRESLVNRVGDEYLQNGFAVLALDGPGQSESAVRGIYTSPEAWTEAGAAVLRWLGQRNEVDPDKIVATGISFGSYFMTLAAATNLGFRACAVALQCFEPGGHAIFEQAAPAFKARHMWMAGMTHDERAFDVLASGYDLRAPIADMRSPWFVLGGEADELCDKAWVYEMANRCGAPASSMLYQGATHALVDSPAPALGPYFRTEIADWLADRVADDPKPAQSTHELVTRSGLVVPVDQHGRLER